jgi:hypothetical protein
MAGRRLQKTVHYKRATSKDSAFHLQGAVDDALQAKRKAESRMEILGLDDSERRFVNACSRRKGMLFGQMLHYEAGKPQSLIVLDDGAEEYLIEDLPIGAGRDGKRRELMDSVLYFGILENHVALVASRGFGSREFETHLHWLLNDCAKTVRDGLVYILQDQPTTNARENIGKASIKTVRIGAPLGAEPVPAITPGPRGHATTRFRPVGQAIDALEAFFGDDWRAQLQLRDALDDANLYVRLDISYRRTTSDQGEHVLRNVCQAARHYDPDDAIIELQGGGMLRGDDLKLSGKISVNTVASGALDSQDLYTQMEYWLRDRMQQGLIGQDVCQDCTI